MINKIKYNLDDVIMEPATLSIIRSRKDISILDDSGMLPIFTAPMSTVCDMDNFEYFQESKVNTIIPRNISLEKRLSVCEQTMIAIGLGEVNLVIESKYQFPMVCIDVANGHMIAVLSSARKIKESKPGSIIMAGNIANPSVLSHYDRAGIDYVRVGIGGGTTCITASNVATYYPYASLISECREIKNNKSLNIKIVADGGLNSYSRCIKALGLGADYIMIGTGFSAVHESAAPILVYNGDLSVDEIVDFSSKVWLEDKIKKGLKFKKKIYGMSTKQAQEEIDPNAKKKTSEGLYKVVDSEYSLNGYLSNLTDYLRSAMSYASCENLKYFTSGDVIFNIVQTVGHNK